MKGNMDFSECLRVWCTTDELDEMWSVKVEDLEEDYRKVIELRDVDAGRDLIQVFAAPHEFKTSEGGKDRVCWRGQTSVFPVEARERGFECKGQVFKACQCGKACDHRLG
jgi:hypothetical protein